MTKMLFNKKCTATTYWSVNDGEYVQSYIKIALHFDFKEGLRFTVSIPNVTYCERNIFKALLLALEHESIGMAKYNVLKEKTGFYK